MTLPPQNAPDPTDDYDQVIVTGQLPYTSLTKLTITMFKNNNPKDL